MTTRPLQVIVKALRNKLNLSQEELARKAELTKDYISKIERGGSINLRIETIRQLAKALEVAPYELMSFEEVMAENTQPIRAGKLEEKKIPVIGRGPCGKWKDFTDLDYPAGHADDWHEGFGTKDKNAFYIRAEGDSMIDGDIHEGDYLLVEPNARVVNGCKVLAKDPKYGCTVKLFYKDKDGNVRLMPMNPKYEPIYVEPNDDFKVYKISGKFSKF